MGIVDSVVSKLKNPSNWAATFIIVAVIAGTGILAFGTSKVQEILGKIGR